MKRIVIPQKTAPVVSVNDARVDKGIVVHEKGEFYGILMQVNGEFFVRNYVNEGSKKFKLLSELIIEYPEFTFFQLEGHSNE